MFSEIKRLFRFQNKCLDIYFLLISLSYLTLITIYGFVDISDWISITVRGIVPVVVYVFLFSLLSSKEKNHLSKPRIISQNHQLKFIISHGIISLIVVAILVVSETSKKNCSIILGIFLGISVFAMIVYLEINKKSL